MKTPNRMARLLIGTVALALTAGTLLAAEPDKKAWLENWQRQNPQWRALHLLRPRPEGLPKLKQLITEALAPMGFNALILQVDYDFQFQSHPELDGTGMNKEQARDMAETCRKSGIRLIPMLNCLGHQSARGGPSALLKMYPEFDQTPRIPITSKTIYCREWCPSNREVYPIIFDLFDELIDAFQADAFHVGMDEVFLIGADCPRCEGKNVADLFAGVVNRLHKHLVDEKGVEMLMWGDRFLKSPEYGSKWAASLTGTHPAIDLVPKDIIICDWHYPLQDDYPSVRLFQEKGFRVLPATWNSPEAAVALIRCAEGRDRPDAGHAVHQLVGRRRAAVGSPQAARRGRRRARSGGKDRKCQTGHSAAACQGDQNRYERTDRAGQRGQMTAWQHGKPKIVPLGAFPAANRHEPFQPRSNTSMASEVTRRDFLGTAGTLTAGATVGAMMTAAAAPAAESAAAAKTLKIVGICCSPRKGKTTATALQVCLAAAKAVDPRIEVELIELAGMKIPGEVAAGIALEPGERDDFPPLAARLRDPAIAGIILGTPVYFGNMSSQCKAFLERCMVLHKEKVLANKVGGVLAVGGARNGGVELTVRSVQVSLMSQQLIVVGDAPPTGHWGGIAWAGAEAVKASPDNDITRDEPGMATMKNLGRRVAEVALCLAPR